MFYNFTLLETKITYFMLFVINIRTKIFNITLIFYPIIRERISYTRGSKESGPLMRFFRQPLVCAVMLLGCAGTQNIRFGSVRVRAYPKLW
uniref:Secreted protein n=1 Tax=Trichogramma kaykai TaxID=54128 RepID=A0ABD2X4B1_9HYME